MDDDFRRVVLGQQDKRSAIASKRKMWKRGIIPYQFLDEGEHKVSKSYCSTLFVLAFSVDQFQ